MLKNLFVKILRYDIKLYVKAYRWHKQVVVSGLAEVLPRRFHCSQVKVTAVECGGSAANQHLFTKYL